MNLHKKHLGCVLDTMLKHDWGDPFIKGYLMSLVAQGIISLADFQIFYPEEL